MAYYRAVGTAQYPYGLIPRWDNRIYDTPPLQEYEDDRETEVKWKHLKRIKKINEKGGGRNRMNNMPRLFRYLWYALPLIILYYIAFHIQPVVDFIVKVFILHK